MMISIALLLTALAAPTQNAFQFQAETVPYSEMKRGIIAAELMQLASFGGGTVHMVVRFDEPIDNEIKQKLSASGMTIQHSLGGSAYISAIDPQLLSARIVLGNASIREIRPFEPTWKLHSFLADGRIPTWTMPVATTQAGQVDPIVAFYVMFHADVDLQHCSEDLASVFNGKVRSTIESNNTVVVELRYSMIEHLIEDERVLYVEPALPKFSELNNSNRVVTQADAAQAAPYNLDGSGVSVMVYDGGYGYSAHGDFGGRHTTRDSSALSNHATHVAGTIGGDGTGSGGLYKGMAPAVTIESYGFEQEGGLSEGFLYTDPGDLALDYGDAINTHGAVLANNSIGTNTAPNGFPCEWTGNYGITSNLIDGVVRGDLGAPIRIVWANGNERGSSNCGTLYNSTAPPACAKNHITVGAFNSDDESMTYFSSWGPTDDGRIKPDISAPGCQNGDDGGVTSCSSSGGYTNMCGTSMACPTVTGLSALIMQDWRLQYPGEPDMQNATLKALLAHTAEDKFNVGPDCQYGYGSVRVVNAIDHIRSENHAELEISHGETVEMLVYVQQPGEVKVTIAWDDVPATPLVIPSLVNDIDLAVIDPNGTTHYPWTIDPANPGNPAVRTQADHLNNIEQVQIDAAQAGVYRIVLTGFNIAQGPQQFGIMASPMLIACSSAGSASLDRSMYACGATVDMQVVDCDLNTSDTMIDSVNITVASTSGDETTQTLFETGEATSSFRGNILLGSDLLAGEGDIITFSYTDSDNGQGGINVVVTDSATIDCSDPTVNSVNVSEVMTFEATVTIITNEPTSAQVNYGASCSDLPGEAVSSALATTHDIVLSGLTDNTSYHFSVDVFDAAGNMMSDNNGGSCYAFTTVDMPDYFTEQFSSGFDLDGLSITYTPHSNVDGYRACAEPITELPTYPIPGNTVSLSDDSFSTHNLSQAILLYGQQHSNIYIGSNGQLTMSSGSSDYTEDIGEHFAQPGISMLWDDLNPANGGSVWFAELVDKVVVTFDGVPEYSSTGSNTFQCELYYDGVITLSWLNVSSADSVVGLSGGSGQPAGFIPSDLSIANSCGDPTMPGDANGDMLVNVADILAVMDAWGSCVSCPADLNGDGVVDVVDLLEVVGNWD
jgi:hypothetical protein